MLWHSARKERSGQWIYAGVGDMPLKEPKTFPKMMDWYQRSGNLVTVEGHGVAPVDIDVFSYRRVPTQTKTVPASQRQRLPVPRIER